MHESRCCHNCDSRELAELYSIKNVPVHSCLLMPTREAALCYPTGEIRLEFCHACGFIQNGLFDPQHNEYSSNYEETQSFSPTFNVFHRQVAERLINKYGLTNKDVIEIGCGKGEFITMLCDLGANRGVGFDPSYIPERNHAPSAKNITFIRDLYSEAYTSYSADFVCCKMTLEHIQPTSDFVGMVRRAIGDRLDTIVFFQVPDVERILEEQAFWDIYYEHCSYFSLSSLEKVFQENGFEVLETDKEYDGQYLMIEAKPITSEKVVEPKTVRSENPLLHLAEKFQQLMPQKISGWKEKIKKWKEKEKRVVLWGSGSKGVAFLTTLGVHREIEYVVDINPFKHGKFLAGTGQQIVSPIFLKEYQPDVVIVMNPIYCDEIQAQLSGMQVNAELIPV
jgi:SAM-dependent methyltransferase